ncbi:hypothetical protein D3C81_1457060 [compost metagenome]
MRRPTLFNNPIFQRTQTVMLYQLLKLRLEIAHLHLQLAVRLHQREDMIIKKPPRRFQALVEIERSHEGFEHIGQQGRAGSSARKFFPFTQQYKPSEAQTFSELDQRRLAHNSGPQLGQFTFRPVRQKVVQIFRNRKLQHSIAKKLKTFIVLMLVETVFIDIRCMGKGLLQEYRIVKLDLKLIL